MDEYDGPTPDVLVEVSTPAGTLAIAAFFVEGLAADTLSVVVGCDDPASIAAVATYLEIARDALLQADWNLLLPEGSGGGEGNENDLPF